MALFELKKIKVILKIFYRVCACARVRFISIRRNEQCEISIISLLANSKSGGYESSTCIRSPYYSFHSISSSFSDLLLLSLKLVCSFFGRYYLWDFEWTCIVFPSFFLSFSILFFSCAKKRSREKCAHIIRLYANNNAIRPISDGSDPFCRATDSFVTFDFRIRIFYRRVVRCTS